jgi:hypothetical protein
MTGLEQRRRNFKREDAALYAYIVAIETARALDSAGDEASGAADSFGAADRVWARSATHKAFAARMREDEYVERGPDDDA